MDAANEAWAGEAYLLQFHDERGVLICMEVPREWVVSEISKALRGGTISLSVMADRIECGDSKAMRGGTAELRVMLAEQNKG